FNVGSNDQNYQIDDIAHIISHSLGGIPIDRDHSSLDVRDYKVSFAKVRQRLCFQTKVSIANACKAIYEKLQAGIIKDPTERIYYNHYFDSTEE
ncbi:MAG: hypothetical protein MN733_13345, partial [Nitrososphaera sp.]|nr:hypothetical protein [Nitrososphaera sp.]